MIDGSQNGHSRRTVVGVVALAALGAAGLAKTATAAQQRSVSGGIAGGGVAKIATGKADFSLVATRMASGEGEEPTVFGHVRWVDPDWEGQGLTLVSTEVSDYGPLGGDPASPVRVIRGLMSANGEGSYPFEVRATDAGPDRFGEDTIALVVGAAAAAATPAATALTASTDDFSYVVDEAPVTGGNLELLVFDAGPG